MKTPIATIIILLAVLLAALIIYKKLEKNEELKPIEEPKVIVEEPKDELKIEQPEIKPPEKITIKPEPIRKIPNNYEDALAYARSREAKFLLVFTSNNCPACGPMKTTLSDENVKAAFKKNNICLIYYINTNSTGSESKQTIRYRVSSVPAYFVVSQDEKIEKKGVGYKDVTSFVSWINGEE